MLMVRELEREDVLVVNEWRRNRELIACLGAPYRFIGPEVDDTWFDAYLASRGNVVRCVTVDESDTGKPLCLSTLSGIDWVNGSCEFHIMIGDEASRGRGIGYFSTCKMLEHAFDDLGLRRVELSVLDTNKAARGLYEKVGFRCEGTKRQARLKGGQYVDMHIMALLKSEWRTSGGSSLS